MSMQKEGKFMVAMGAIVENEESGKILLLKRTSKADFSGGIWEDITGRMKQFEEPNEALKREIQEECGLEVEIVKPINVFHLFRGEKNAENELVGIIFWCKAQSETVTLSGEHTEYKWVTPAEALSVVEHPGVTEDIKAFLKEKGL